MNTEDSKNKEKSSADSPEEKRKLKDRRVSMGRRDKVRFDEKGGDRRSGNARRTTDMGFRDQSDEDDE